MSLIAHSYLMVKAMYATTHETTSPSAYFFRTVVDYSSESRVRHNFCTVHPPTF